MDEEPRNRLDQSAARREEERQRQTSQLGQIIEDSQQPVRKLFGNKYITFEEFKAEPTTGGRTWETMELHPDDSHRYYSGIAASLPGAPHAIGMSNAGGRKLKHRRKSRRRNKSRRHRK